MIENVRVALAGLRKAGCNHSCLESMSLYLFKSTQPATKSPAMQDSKEHLVTCFSLCCQDTQLLTTCRSRIVQPKILLVLRAEEDTLCSPTLALKVVRMLKCAVNRIDWLQFLGIPNRLQQMQGTLLCSRLLC